MNSETLPLTRSDRRASLAAIVAATMLLGVLLAPPVRAAGITVALVPPATVHTNDGFDLDVQVTNVSDPFNGFDAVIVYDPAVLTFQQASPVSSQQGCLMTGTCSVACGSTFHQFHAAADSCAITDVLLCNQVDVHGPGQVYKLHFKAPATAQTTHVGFRHAAFYDGGIRDTSLTTNDVDIAITVPVGVGDAPLPGALSLRASPEPARGPLRFTIDAPRPGPQRLEIHDLMGRRVRLVASGWQPAGTRSVEWDGRDESGAPLPTGVYLATLHAGDAIARTRLTLLR